MKSRSVIFSLIAASLAVALVGCSSSSKQAAAPITINLSVVPSTLAEGSSTPIFALVNNDGLNEGVTWAVSCGGSACGTLSSVTSHDAVYTAPPTVISGSVTVTATSVANSSVTATASFAITPATAPGDGTFVFALAGGDGNGVYHVAGAFVVSGGKITGGEQDFLDAGTFTQENKIANGTIKTAAQTSGNFQINLNISPNSNGFFPFSGTETLEGTMINGVHGLVIEYDGNATSSGTIDLQTSSAAPTGSYSFVLSGLDSGGTSAAIGGVLNVDTANGLDGSGSVFDVNDGFNVSQDLPVDSGTISTTDPLSLNFGRVTVSLVLQNSGFGGLGLVGYMIDANHIKLVENSNDPNDVFFGGGPGDVGGTAFGQGTNAGAFTAASPSVSGASYVLATSGTDVFGFYQVAGIVTLNPDLSASATLNFNDLSGTPQTPVPFTGGTYTIDPTGRVTLMNLADPTATYFFNFQMYLDGNGNATVISVDSPTVDPNVPDEVAGVAAQQTAGAFSASSFNGSYGLNVTGWLGNEFDEIGTVAADGNSSLSGAVDQNLLFFTGSTQGNVTTSGSFAAAANGVFIEGLTGMTGLDVSGNSDVFTYYLIDPTRVVAIETDQNQLTLGYFELKQ